MWCAAEEAVRGSWCIYVRLHSIYAFSCRPAVVSASPDDIWDGSQHCSTSAESGLDPEKVNIEIKGGRVTPRRLDFAVSEVNRTDGT